MAQGTNRGDALCAALFLNRVSSSPRHDTFLFLLSKQLKTAFGLAKSRRVSTNAKKNVRRRHSLPMGTTRIVHVATTRIVPIQKIKNDSGSNPIRVGFESDSNHAVVHPKHKKRRKRRKKKKTHQHARFIKTQKQKNTTHQRAR